LIFPILIFGERLCSKG